MDEREEDEVEDGGLVLLSDLAQNFGCIGTDPLPSFCRCGEELLRAAVSREEAKSARSSQRTLDGLSACHTNDGRGRI